jgi:bifunctional DNA-binding transcriptional regulator/antitoxin component of YhaV-PrlF toxin-antitoxin module
MFSMSYQSKLQVIQRGLHNRQYYLICPAPLAAALELEKGEALEWVIIDRHTFEIRRVKSAAPARRASHE